MSTNRIKYQQGKPITWKHKEEIMLGEPSFLSAEITCLLLQGGPSSEVIFAESDKKSSQESGNNEVCIGSCSSASFLQNMFVFYRTLHLSFRPKPFANRESLYWRLQCELFVSELPLKLFFQFFGKTKIVCWLAVYKQ
jgi:hypothetical protein